MMMLRKTLWLGAVLITISAALLLGSAEAKSKKKKHRLERVSSPPSLSLSAEPSVIRNCGDDVRVRLNAAATSSSGRPLRYRWTTDGGKLSSNDSSPTWDFVGAQPGVYHAVVEVDDGTALTCVAFSSVAVVVNGCPPREERPVCPIVNVSCPDAATENAAVTFTANISGGSGNIAPPSYNWTISNGRIISGQGTQSITVDTTGLAGQTIRATVDVSGYGAPCSANCSVSVPIEITSHKFDEYYDIAHNDEKARLDNYAIQLQSEPGSKGYVIVHPKRGVSRSVAASRADRIKDYLVNSRGIDQSRFEVVIGPERENWLFELWVVPPGAKPPVP